MRGLSKAEKHQIRRAVRSQLDRVGRFTGLDILQIPSAHRRTAMQEIHKRTDAATHHDARYCRQRHGFFSEEVQG